MKTKTTLLLISSFLLLLALSSSRCSKGKDEQPYTDNCPCKESNLKIVPDSFRNWFWFTDDSWWVYQLKEDPSQFDTIKVVNKWKLMDYLPCHYITDVQALPCSQVLLVNVQHSNSIYFPFNKDTTMGAFDKINGYYGGVDILKLHYISSNSLGAIYAEPSSLNEKFTRLCLKDRFDNYEFNGQVFSNVFHSQICDTSTIYRNSIRNIYWAKNVGLLKLQIVNSDTLINTWELIDFNVKIEN